MAHILCITERYPPLGGGMAMSCQRQVNSLRRRGHHVDVLFLCQRPGEKGIGIKNVVRDGGNELTVSHDDRYGNASQRAYRDIYDTHMKNPYDMIFGFGACFPGYLAVTYAAFLQCPSLVSVRGNDFDRDWFEPKRAHFVQQALSRADRIAAVSSEKVHKINALYPAKPVFFCPNGLDATLFELLPGERETKNTLRSELNGDGRRIIGLFGELKYKKQVPEFLAVLRAAGLKDKVSLLITGRMNEECQALINDPGLSPQNRHISFRDPDKLSPLYGACDFMAIPSLFEGFPNVLLESMAAGVVPIVSAAGAMCDVIEHGKTGFIMDPLDSHRGANVLTDALSLSHEALASMKRRVKDEVAHRFTPEKEADILEAEVMKTIHAFGPMPIKV